MVQDWSFWAVAGGLVLAVAFVLVQALRRGGEAAASGGGGPDLRPDLQIYRDQLAEVERDAARGLLSAEEAARVRTEVARRLLDADRAGQKASAPRVGPPQVLALTLVLAVLTGSVWIYARIGAPGYPDLPLSDRLALSEEAYRSRPSQAEAEKAATAIPDSAPKPDADFLDLMDKLRAAIRERPDDIAGLELLARNEAALTNFAAAAKAQGHLVALLGAGVSDAQEATLAQYLIAAAGGYVSPEAEAALIRTLELNPKNPLARYFSGLMWAQVGRPDRGFALWEPLLEEGPPDAPWIAPIRAGIGDLADLAGITYDLPEAKGPSAEDVEAAGRMSAEDRQAMIEGMVSGLETQLQDKGGAVEDWLKLLNALRVLGEPERLQTALSRAEAAYPAETGRLREAAGITP